MTVLHGLSFLYSQNINIYLSGLIQTAEPGSPCSFSLLVVWKTGGGKATVHHQTTNNNTLIHECELLTVRQLAASVLWYISTITNIASYLLRVFDGEEGSGGWNNVHLLVIPWGVDDPLHVRDMLYIYVCININKHLFNNYFNVLLVQKRLASFEWSQISCRRERRNLLSEVQWQCFLTEECFHALFACKNQLLHYLWWLKC